MGKLIKIILPEVGVGDLKIRPRGDNRCESAKSVVKLLISAELSVLRTFSVAAELRNTTVLTLSTYTTVVVYPP